MSSVAGVRKCPGLCSDQSVSLTVTVSLSSISTLVCHLNSQTQTPARTGSDRSVTRSLGSEARLVTRQSRCLAVILGRADTAKILVDSGADVNNETEGWTVVRESTARGTRN